ncbi:Alpha-1,3-mannosyl-glycoprotein 4-beta-N-acetylglucosaminyltransferase C, partial [Galemys pyrenaicus]
EEKEELALQRAQMQINTRRTKHLESFKDMQEHSGPFANVNPHILLGAPPAEKKLLTIGISSEQQCRRNYLLDTLQSLFSASSSSEWKHFIVLVYLACPDHGWLGPMTANISTLFRPYIQAGQLIVINNPLKSYLPLKKHKKKLNDNPAYVASYSKQNMDYAFFMNFATQYSDYFLMVDDGVKCAPGFVTQIAATVSAWEYKPWVTLEFSQLAFTGKLFHTRDLPSFAHFLLLFYQEMPYGFLLTHFHDLMQQTPIQFFPSLFQHMGNFSSFGKKSDSLNDKEFEENDIGSPSNPTASVYTNLEATNETVPMNAYSLNGTFFHSKVVEVGSHLTVVLDKPARVFRVQVLTGSHLKDETQLKGGQVELGFDSTNRITNCDDYILLGLLENGTLNKQVLYNESGKKIHRAQTMQQRMWPYIVIAGSLIFLSFFQENNEEYLDYSVSLEEEKKKIVWQLNEELVSNESKNHLETFKEMQKNSPLLQCADYKFLAGAPPWKRKLLTVGISSMQHPQGSALLDTLKSLFEGSTETELNCIVVLVHLLGPDSEWLSQVVANIQGLFKAHLEAQRLLVIQGGLGAAPCPGELQGAQQPSGCEALYPRQKAGFALLMNFAINMSENFLLLEDNVRCAPRFVSTIYWTLLAWEDLPWVMLEFSSLRFSGKVFHSRDLHRLASFLLLFRKDAPTQSLLSEFHLLLAQSVPIRLSPSIFHHVDSYSVSADTCFPEQEEKAFGEPDNPSASVLSDMMTIANILPDYAYFLNKECFSTLDAVSGNYLTVVFERPQNVVRIEVLTGSEEQGQYRMQRGQVELGYEPLADARGCARYSLLGPLVEGNLDQRVFYEADSVEQLSCIRLLLLAAQESWLLIRQIKVWTQSEEEEGSMGAV